MTIAADAVALNIIVQALFVSIYTIMIKEK